MNITTSLLLSLISEGVDLHLGSNRHLQSLPDYTSPPLLEALEATPKRYRPDSVIDFAREAAKNNLCSSLDASACQILFQPGEEFDSSPSLGVVFYGGALVDPRAYSPLAAELAERYGLAVSIPIFDRDIAFVGCESDKLHLAGLAFPTVEKWVMAGHSLGGIGVMAEIWTAVENQTSVADMIGGFALVGSYLRQDVGCGAVDFRESDIPAASINGDLDLIMTVENLEKGIALMSEGTTLHMSLNGANHGYFGSYDYTERKTLLGQIDGNATIPREIQQDLTVSGIMHVVSRVGLPLPTKEGKKKVKKKKVKKKGGRY